MFEPQYERYEQRSAPTGGFMMGLVCGAAVGAAIGLMCAPRSGAHMRQQILDSTEELRRQAANTYEQASKVISDLACQGREALNRTISSFEGKDMGQTGNGGNRFGTGSFQST